jgi:peptide-methionine (S)-S-oxide reductase
MSNRYLIVGLLLSLGALTAVAAGALYYAGRAPERIAATPASLAAAPDASEMPAPCVETQTKVALPGALAKYASKETKTVITAKIADSKSGKVEVATFGAGCYWGVESTFRALPGVLSTSVGFSGGHVDNPTYKDVCYTDTGHAEVVRVEFDPEQIGYAKLVDVFFDTHNPTTINRQGPDFGSQYRSVIFFHSDAQRSTAEAAKERLQQGNRWQRPIVTQIVQAGKYFPAHEEHQQYNEKRGLKSCHL